jgi:hypothetical protein
MINRNRLSSQLMCESAMRMESSSSTPFSYGIERPRSVLAWRKIPL